MRSRSVIAIVTPLLAGLLAGSAPAQAAPPVVNVTSPEPVQPIAPPPVSADGAGAHALQERLFASEALSWSRSGVTRGGVPVDTRSFYTLVGRDDLLKRIRTRRTAKTVLIAGGATAITLGVLEGIAETICNGGNCSDSRRLPTALLIGGAIAILIGIAVPSDPLDSREKSDLVSDYNRRLRATLGL